MNIARRGAAAAATGQRGPAPATAVSRKAAVIIEIRRSIVLGRLKPGDKLTEASLTASLGVSRPTVREALTELTREGLIVQEPYRGIYVADVTFDQIRDIAVSRVALDMLAIDAILADETGAKLEQVREVWSQFERHAFDPDPLVQHDTHVGFHRGLWVASGNYMLLQLWPVVEAHLTLALAEDQAARSDPDRAYRLHKQLVDAILTRDRDVIHAAFAAHTIDSAEELIALLDAQDSADVSDVDANEEESA